MGALQGERRPISGLRVLGGQNLGRSLLSQGELLLWLPPPHRLGRQKGLRRGRAHFY